MKTIIALAVTLVLLMTIGLNPVSKGVKYDGIREAIHMNRLSHTLASLDSGSDGVGGFSFDRGHSSWFS